MLPLSRPKLALVTNTSSSAKKFKISFVRLSRAVVKSARNLGMDYAAGARRFSSVRIKRFGVVARRARRRSVLARPGRRAATVVRMSLAPSALYGIGITGMLPSHLQRLRGIFHGAVVSHARGRSATWDFKMLRKLDPAIEVMVRPVLLLAAGVQHGWIGRPMIRQSVAAGIHNGGCPQGHRRAHWCCFGEHEVVGMDLRTRFVLENGAGPCREF